MAAPASPIPLSRQISYTTTASSDKDNIIFTTNWTEEQETRLLYCQTELKGAQRRWSESQELWIEEYHTLTLFRNQVEHLTDLKKAHLKAQKKALKQQAQAKKVAAIWKKKTFKLSRRSSKANTGTNTPAMGGLSRVNSGINTFITNGLSRRSTEVNTGANTPAMGGLSRRSSGFVSGNEDNEEDDDDTDDDEPDEDEDDDEDEEDVEDEEDTLGGLTQLSRKSSELPSSAPPSRRPSLSNALRKLSISGIRRRSTIPGGEDDNGSPAGDGSPSAPSSPGLRRRG